MISACRACVVPNEDPSRGVMAPSLSTVVLVALSFITPSVIAVPCQGDRIIGPDVRVITSDNYPNNYEDYTYCRYFITGPPNTQLTLTFTGTFQVEQIGSTCDQDRVSIYDTSIRATNNSLSTSRACRSTASPAFGPFCGNTLPPRAQTVRRNRAVVEFCSDYGIAGTGWRINLTYAEIEPEPTLPPWQTPIITLEKVAAVNFIRSPNYPSNYNDSYVANYIIRKTNRDWVVQLKSLLFDLGPGCEDNLVVHDVTNNVRKEFCGVDQDETELDYYEIRNSEEIHVTFTADDEANYRGFLIEVTTLACATNLLACDDNVGCYHPNVSCNAVNDCADGSDEKWEYCAPECGVSHFPIRTENALKASRIVGGVIANKNSLPWQVALIRPSGSQFCGGSIISDRWILTAAHCFRNSASTGWNPATGYTVRIGSHTMSRTAESEGGISIEVEKIVCHPYFSRNPTDHDVCLLKLREHIPFRKNIAPICLPHADAPVPAPGTACMASGWGRRISSNSEPTSEHLRQVYVPIMPIDACNTTIGEQSGYALTPRMICTATPDGGFSTCQGDSGGPYVCPNAAGQWEIHGVTSWGYGCAPARLPAVYAKVTYFTHWIVDSIAQN